LEKKFKFQKFFGAIAKLHKATISFVMSVRPSFRPSVCLSVFLSVRVEELGFRWTDFYET
jgi:hypothetical protein